MDRRERADRLRKLAPMRQRVQQLEQEIAVREAEQRQRSVALADSDTYADATKRRELLAAYQTGVTAIEEATAAWEIALAELERAEADA
jgi:hypothetical protein